MNDIKSEMFKCLKKAGFIDIYYNKDDGFCGTLNPYSNIRPFQKEKIRYHNITGIIPKLIFTHFDKIEPVIIDCQKEEIL